METKKGEPLWWLRIKVSINILLTRLIRVIFEILVLVVFLFDIWVMLFNNNYFKRRAIFYFRELSDFSKPKTK